MTEQSLVRKHNPKLTANARYLRKHMTEQERHLWYCFLKNYPVCFYRQKVLGPYVADFYCAKAKLIVELDGSEHMQPKGIAHDRTRTSYLQRYGCTVLRIPNTAVKRHFRSVCDCIDLYVHLLLAGENPSVE